MDMSNCEQTQGMSVLEHGVSVHDYFLDLYNHFKKGDSLKKDWRLPEWLSDEWIWENIELTERIRLYHIYHDCGKPYCIHIDSDGKKHFPDHANKSYHIWLDLLGDLETAELMRDDMLIHLLRSGGVDDFAKNKNALILLITGLCEIHSNAEMFGGIDSTSFKIKWKNINKFGKRIIEKIKKQEEQ